MSKLVNDEETGIKDRKIERTKERKKDERRKERIEAEERTRTYQ